MKRQPMFLITLLLMACADEEPPTEPDAAIPDAGLDEADAQSDADELPDAAQLDVPPPVPTTVYEADCDVSVYVDLSGQGAWPYYTSWFATFPLSDLDGPIQQVVKVLMCDPHSQNNGRCPPYWNCDRDEDPEHPGCVWTTHEMKNDGLSVACGQEYFGLIGSDFDFYRYRFQTALLEVTHRQ